MKFVCDACSARYHIDDKKVAGKILRIRCKKCSHIITVQEPARATHPNLGLTVPVPTPAGVEWHYSVNGQATGPLTEEALLGLFSSGRVGDEAYVWNADFSEWKPAFDVPVFRAAITNAKAAARAAGRPATERLDAAQFDNLKLEARAMAALGEKQGSGEHQVFARSESAPHSAVTDEAAALAAQRAEEQRLAAERAEQERLAAERAEQERRAAERAEQERIAAERAEQERIAAERAEQERIAAERAEQERIAAERAEQERIAAERAEQERIAAERAEQERIAAERAEQERIAAERAEQERIAAERAEQERIAAERAEQERIAAERAEQERLAAERAEEERLATEPSRLDQLAERELSPDDAQRLLADREKSNTTTERLEKIRAGLRTRRERKASAGPVKLAGPTTSALRPIVAPVDEPDASAETDARPPEQPKRARLGSTASLNLPAPPPPKPAAPASDFSGDGGDDETVLLPTDSTGEARAPSAELPLPTEDAPGQPAESATPVQDVAPAEDAAAQDGPAAPGVPESPADEPTTEFAAPAEESPTEEPTSEATVPTDEALQAPETEELSLDEIVPVEEGTLEAPPTTHETPADDDATVEEPAPETSGQAYEPGAEEAGPIDADAAPQTAEAAAESEAAEAAAPTAATQDSTDENAAVAPEVPDDAAPEELADATATRPTELPADESPTVDLDATAQTARPGDRLEEASAGFGALAEQVEQEAAAAAISGVDFRDIKLLTGGEPAIQTADPSKSLLFQVAQARAGRRRVAFGAVAFLALLGIVTLFIVTRPAPEPAPEADPALTEPAAEPELEIEATAASQALAARNVMVAIVRAGRHIEGALTAANASSAPAPAETEADVGSGANEERPDDRRSARDDSENERSDNEREVEEDAGPANDTGRRRDRNGLALPTPSLGGAAPRRGGPGAEHFAEGMRTFINTSITRCNQRHVAEEGALERPRVEISITVQPSGRVQSLELASGLRETAFGRCLQSHRERWLFPRFDGDPVTLQKTYVVQ